MARITIEFPEQVDKILRELAEKGDTSKVDVIRRALALYNYVNKEVKEKDLKLTVSDEDKILKEIVLDL
jgi:predicted transcriptional regulator